MAKLIAMYKKPANVQAFDTYYYSTHVPIAKKVPGLRRYEVSTGPVVTPAGDSPFHLIATLTFDSMGAIQQALGSPEGAAGLRAPQGRGGKSASSDVGSSRYPTRPSRTGRWVSLRSTHPANPACNPWP